MNPRTWDLGGWACLALGIVIAIIVAVIVGAPVSAFEIPALVLAVAGWFLLIRGAYRMGRARLDARTQNESPLTHDLCDTCHKPLHLNERVEVMVGEPEFDSEFGGSFAMLATYCQECKP